MTRTSEHRGKLASLVGRVRKRIHFITRAPNLVDLRDQTDNPIEAYYLSGGRSFLLDMRLSQATSWLGFPLTELHPYVRTAKAILNDPRLEYVSSPLAEYYNHFQPKTAAGVLDLTDTASTAFAGLKAIEFVYPWSTRTPAAVAANRKRISALEGRLRGGNIGKEDGLTIFGPVSDAKGRMEFNTLVRLVRSIQKSGYKREMAPDDIRVKLAFDREENVRFLIGAGHHRAAVLSALNYNSAPVRVALRKELRVQHAAFWPHVMTGLYSTAQAVDTFTRMFEGHPPRKAAPPRWSDIARKTAGCFAT